MLLSLLLLISIFIFYHNPHYTRHIKQKILQSPGNFIFPVPGKKENSKLKQSEIKVKMIMKMKKHNSCSNWEIVFMSDTNRQTLIFMRS